MNAREKIMKNQRSRKSHMPIRHASDLLWADARRAAVRDAANEQHDRDEWRDEQTRPEDREAYLE